MFSNQFIPETSNKSLHTVHSQPTFHNCDIQKVITGLYIGDQLVASNKSLLQDLNIKHIVVAGLQLKTFYPQNFNYLSIPVRDHRKQNILKYFNQTNQFIGKGLIANEGVFVHCAKGVSRSATIVIAYLMSKYKMKRQQAINFTKRKRKQISPNEGFLVQLQKYQQILKQTNKN